MHVLSSRTITVSRSSRSWHLQNGHSIFSAMVLVSNEMHGASYTHPAKDPKCRFFWKMTETPPYETAFPSLNMPNVVPEHFKDVWSTTLDKWGKSMKNA